MSPITAPPVDRTARVSASRTAGVAALTKAATYVVGFAVMGAYLAPRGFIDATSDPAGSLAFLLENQAAMYVWYLVLYLVGGFALIVLVVTLHDRLRAAPATTRLMTAAVGLVWAGLLLASGLMALVGQTAVAGLAGTDEPLAISTWSAVSVIQDALGGGIEIVGAVWVVLLSVVGRRAGSIGRGLAALGIAIGVAGAGTLLPASADTAGSLFGLGFVVWFVWVGLVALRDRA